MFILVKMSANELTQLPLHEPQKNYNAKNNAIHRKNK